MNDGFWKIILGLHFRWNVGNPHLIQDHFSPIWNSFHLELKRTLNKTFYLGDTFFRTKYQKDLKKKLFIREIHSSGQNIKSMKKYLIFYTGKKEVLILSL